MKKQLVLYVLLLCFCAHGWAQASDSISVEIGQLLQVAADTSQSKIADSLTLRALNMARSSANENAIIACLMLAADISLAKSETNKALSHLLEIESRSTKNTSESKANLRAVYQKMGDLFFEEQLYSNAIDYYQKLLKENPANMQLHEKVADAYLANQKFKEAEDQYKDLIRYYKSIGERTKLIAVYQKIANAYDRVMDDGKALLYYLRIKDLVEQGGSLRDKAVLYNNLGRRFMQTGEYPTALGYFRNSELQCDYLQCDFLPILFTNHGICLHNAGQTQKGIDYLLKAKAMLDEQEAVDNELGQLEQLIARTYFSANDTYNALTHNKLAIDYGLKANNRDLLISAYEHAANLHFELYEYEKAYEFYKKFLSLVEARRVDEQARLQNLTQQQFLLERSEKEHRSLLFQQQLKELELEQANLEKEKLEAQNKNLALEAQRKEDEVALLKERELLNESELKAKALEALKAQQELRLAAQNLAAARKDREIIELKQKEQAERQRQAEAAAAQEQKLKDAQYEAEMAKVNLEKEQTFRNFAYGLGALFLVILALLLAGFLFSRRTNLKLNKQNRRIELQNTEIAMERERSDLLLLNILPEEIAQELKEKGAAQPKLHQETTVLFTDFVSFTKLTEGMSAEQLIEELNECFQAFDDICTKHGLEKIKTIGDAYMCVSGLPKPQKDHALNAVNAAFEMVDFLEKRKKNKPTAKLHKMRIGLHSGSVVAGVVGKNKFAYDIWGDTVNTAARMEEHGEAGKISISKSTATLIEKQFTLQERGEIEVSGKGKISMFFVEKL